MQMKMTEPTNKEKKEKRERELFAAFARRSGLNINERSIKSCEESKGEPDICCQIDGRKYFFELTEVVPQKQAEALETKGIYHSSFPDPKQRGSQAMVHRLKEKQEKKYETYGSPVDLLLYFDRDFPMYLPDVRGDIAEPTDIELALAECKRLGAFSRIWSYCSWAGQVKLLA